MRFRPFLMIAIALSFFSTLVLAGPPLICHTYDIGGAASLPWKGSGFRDLDPAYDLNKLSQDTLAILNEKTPLLVRMETIRRAVVYSQWGLVDKKVVTKINDDRYARQLLAELLERARQAEKRGPGSRSAALAQFDAGYLIESLKDADYKKEQMAGLDGLLMVRKARTILQSGDFDFAIAKILSHYPNRRNEVAASVRAAAAQAGEGSLLARNLLSHFPESGSTLTALRR